MKALLFRYSMPKLAAAKIASFFTPEGFVGSWAPMQLEEVPEPNLVGDDWVLVKNRLTGICGSDAKQVFLKGSFDNPMTAVISFPHILGHESIGVVDRVGPAVKKLAVGQRVVLNPWLSCGPRGIHPPCPHCANGDYSLCEHFTEGRIPAGIHMGNCSAVGGAFAPYYSAHESQLIPVPDAVTDTQAVLSDPFSVQLHAILRHPPQGDLPVVVYGCGTLGLMTVAAVRKLHPSIAVWAIARHPHQAQRARELGASEILPSRPLELIERVAALTGVQPYRPWKGLPWLVKGTGTVYDTVGSPASVEAAFRFTSTRAKIVVTGVEAPARFEWTPCYFKELELIGCNAFATEDFEGKRLHAMEIYLELVRRGLDLSSLVTHRYALADWGKAFVAMYDKNATGVVKATFAFD